MKRTKYTKNLFKYTKNLLKSIKKLFKYTKNLLKLIKTLTFIPIKATPMTKKTSTPSTAPHLGSILASHIAKNKVSQASLARALGIAPTAIIGYKKAASMQTKTLWRISRLLKHNFFMDIALLLPDTFSSSTNIFEARDQEIETLKRRIEILEAEKAVLLESRR